MTICLVILLFLIILKLSIFDKKYMLDLLDKNNYTHKVYLEINDEMSDSLLSTGFNNTILSNLYNEEDIYYDIHNFVNNLFDGKKTVVNKDIMRNKLEINIHNFVEKNNITIIDQNDVNLFIDNLVQIYENEICLYHFLDNYVVSFSKINYYIDISIVFLGLVSIMFIFLNKKSPSSFISCGFILLLIVYFALQRIDIDNLIIITEDFSELIISVFKSIIGKIEFGCYIIIFIGMLLKCQQLLFFLKKNA